MVTLRHDTNATPMRLLAVGCTHMMDLATKLNAQKCTSMHTCIIPGEAHLYALHINLLLVHQPPLLSLASILGSL